jgi:hypothetical protein
MPAYARLQGAGTMHLKHPAAARNRGFRLRFTSQAKAKAEAGKDDEKNKRMTGKQWFMQERQEAATEVRHDSLICLCSCCCA